MPFEAITTVVSADTDTTPEGGGTFGLLGEGTPNIRKAAAYTKQAILQLASERLGVPKDQVRTADGKASGGGKEITYGELVKDQDLKLTIPVSGDLTSIFGLRITGDPPLKSASELNVVGKSFKNSIVSEKVRHDALWVTNVKLPGMLHGRVVHPSTLGSQLVQAGTVDATKFPNTHLVVKGNLVGVVAPTEWEAIQASYQVAKATKWSDWKGLPGKDNLFASLRNESDWKAPRCRKAASPRVMSPPAHGREEQTDGYLSAPVLEACSDWSHHGSGRLPPRRLGDRPYAHPERPGAAWPADHDAGNER